MKKQVLILLAFTLLISCSATIQAQTKKLIHYWHFNSTSVGIHLGAIPADYSTLGAASIIYKPIPGGGADTAQAYIDNLVPDAGDTLNLKPGYGGCCGSTNYAVRTRNPSDNMQFLFYLPTRKYQNIVIKYATESSSTGSGQHRQVFSYSLDSAATFITAGLPMAFDSAGLTWGKVVLDLSSIPQISNTNKFVFKMTFTAPNTGTSGNNRFDNISVEGDTMTAPEILSNPITTGIINRPYSYTIKSTGSPTPVYSVSGNPGWLTLTDSILSGTPDVIDTFGPITISASNAIGSIQQVFTLMVGDSINPVSPSITSVAPITGILDSVFTYIIHTAGVPRPTLSVSGNPAWLTLNDSILSGIPNINGVYGPILITASNIVGTDEQSFSITIPAKPAITSAAVTQAIANYPYTYMILTTGTPAPTLSVSGNPYWLSLSGNVLSGMPVAPDTVGPITITATNSEGSTDQVFKIAVLSEPLFTGELETSGTVGSAYSFNITASGIPAPVISVQGNPSWLSLNGNTLSGVPVSSGLIGPITITATNSVSAVKKTFYLNIANPEVNTSASTLIHYWHFNNTLPIDGSGGLYYGIHPLPSDYSSYGTGALVFEPLQGVLSDTGHVDNLVGDTINQRLGFGGCCDAVNNAIRTRNPSDSMQFLWYLPTTNYKNIVIKYETQSSSTKSGQREQIFSYSLDSASTFITEGLPLVSNYADTVWQFVIIDLRGVAEANDNSKLVLRLAFSAPNTGSKGNNRFDNITVEGDSIPVIPNAIHKISDKGYTLYPNPASDKINLLSQNDAVKNVSIYNSTGMLVSTMTIFGKKGSIDISQFSPGLYFVKIAVKNGENESLMKFVKE